MPVNGLPVAKPFPELADPPADYELSVWLSFAFNNYSEDARVADGMWAPVVTGDYALGCGRASGSWWLKALPVLSEDADGEQETGPPVLDLCGQAAGADPLALLRALLSGGSA
jgi:hypothetical protein